MDPLGRGPPRSLWPKWRAFGRLYTSQTGAWGLELGPPGSPFSLDLAGKSGPGGFETADLQAPCSPCPWGPGLPEPPGGPWPPCPWGPGSPEPPGGPRPPAPWHPRAKARPFTNEQIYKAGNIQSPPWSAPGGPCGLSPRRGCLMGWQRTSRDLRLEPGSPWVPWNPNLSTPRRALLADVPRREHRTDLVL